MWLGDRRGHWSDWLTQRWVQATGRVVDVRQFPWLDGPVGATTGIAPTFIADLARSEQLAIRGGPDAGLIPDFGVLGAADFDPDSADRQVVDFYAHTARYEMDSWAEWCGAFRRFGWLLARIFSRRLQQLNVPLTGLDTSRGVSSEVVQLVDPETGKLHYTIWLRRLVHTGNVLYAGCYSVADVPGRAGSCVRVVFPLPNGNAMVLMRPELHADGSMSVVSSGRRFGDPGFYFTVRSDANHVWARYVPSLRESIHVYPAEAATVRADHALEFLGLSVLRIH